jgi:hypothetical protein
MQVRNVIHFFLIFIAGWAWAREGDAIRVAQITPRLSGQSLTVSAVCENLFSDKIVGTIQSGLPAIVQIEIKLKDDRNKQIARRQITRSISYNVWENRYTIAEDSARFFSELAEVKKISSRVEEAVLLSVQQLPPNMRFVIQMRAAVLPISSTQGRKVTDWLLDPNQIEESLPSEDRAGGFKLNLSNLISFFVGGKKQSQYSSDWHSSPTFRLEDLKQE